MLYDPYGDDENGVITIMPEKRVNSVMDITVEAWTNSKGGIQLTQAEDIIALDAEQVEALYQIIKHNR